MKQCDVGPWAWDLSPRWIRPEYWIEGALLGLFMISACLVTALLEHPASPVYQWIPSPWVRRALAGAAMGLTAMGLIYSPWGKRSGAHMNPSVTVSFWRLGKIKRHDAVGYVLGQFAGAVAGVGLIALLLGKTLAHPQVHFAVTQPGVDGIAIAWGAELFISFLLMTVVLWTSAQPTLKSWTGVFAGTLVATYIALEAPFSGMSMNPARSFGSAIFANSWNAFWIYLTAPLLGMWLAAEGSRMWNRNGCAKLQHDPSYRCLFCEGN